MDALALLCNLHADGPATFQRLRRAGCESLAALADMTVAEVATELSTDEAGARRFQREAELLLVRLRGAEEETLSTEEASAPGEPGAGTSEPTGAEIEDGGASPEHGPDVERVLARWRSLDREAPPLPPGEFLVPRPSAGDPGNRALEEVRLEGLTPQLVERLAGLGILSLRGLRDAVTLELARELPIAFTRVRRLQFLAGRALQARAQGGQVAEPTAPAAPSAPRPSVSPVPSEPGDLGSLDTAGPFA